MPSATGSSWFSMNREGQGENPLDTLNAEQLKERLLVAETIMKQ
jgi:hypothetical protein